MYKMMYDAGFEPIRPEAGYFMLAQFGKLDGPFKKPDSTNDPLDFRFARWLCREKKLAVIPPSAFYSDEYKATNETMIRLCFMKDDATMEAARSVLEALK
ncbi:hypothetical protein TELCIR_00989 [Teladorsagia circumcincta]|uniref:Aminotransferase class I/classII domain-containing protein n=1 Tax=Teladorsagia circumcincta TaxID=45464 RepID=A0A2G9V374_TELCI|nr:hypothetical protein TELCIR_00989 [Teladorsagia circumcincta]